MYITAPQNRRIHQLLNMTKETPWKQDWCFEASNYRTGHTSELSVDEAAVMINMLTGVLNGGVAPKNPASPMLQDIDFMGKPLSQWGSAPEPAIPTHIGETEAEKCQRLRRKILKYCHDMRWYATNHLTGTIQTQNGKPKLDYSRIDNFCIKHSKAKKPLNQHSSAELEGKGGLVYQFQIMAKNYTNGQEKK